MYECFMMLWMHTYQFVYVREWKNIWIYAFTKLYVWNDLDCVAILITFYHLVICLLINWFTYFLTYLFWEYLSEPIDSWLQLSWLALEIQASTCPYNPSTEITIAQHCTQLFMFVLVVRKYMSWFSSYGFLHCT